MPGNVYWKQHFCTLLYLVNQHEKRTDAKALLSDFYDNSYNFAGNGAADGTTKAGFRRYSNEWK
jgi:hypothetical protein